MLFTYMTRIVLPLNSISYKIIDELITFIISSKLLLQLCDICFNYGLSFEAFSLLPISYRSLNLFGLYYVYTLCLIFSEEKFYMSYFGSMPRLSVILYEHLHHYKYCNQPFELYRKTYFAISRALSTMKLSSMFISMKNPIHSNDQVSLGGFYQVLNLILLDGYHFIFHGV